MQLVSRLAHALSIVAVDDKYESLRVLEVVPPQWPDLHARRGVRNTPCAGDACVTSAAVTRTLSCPPTSQTVKLMFLYSTVSTLKPAV